MDIYVSAKSTVFKEKNHERVQNVPIEEKVREIVHLRHEEMLKYFFKTELSNQTELSSAEHDVCDYKINLRKTLCQQYATAT